MLRKVLLIEYETRSAERVRGLLPASDFTVVEAHDGEEGLSAFTSSRFDLVVLSGMLPRLPSAEVIREIRRKGGVAAPPILLMVSGYKGTNKKADAQRVGAFDILVKPFEDQEFREAVKQAVESTDVGARTMKIAAADVAAASRLTSEDIFSDVLLDVGGEAVRPSAAVAPPKPVVSAEEEVDRRMRDSLSGILANRTPPRGTAAPSAEPGLTPPHGTSPSFAGPSEGKPRFSTDADIDRMIKDTLSGLRVPHPRSAVVSQPDPDHFGQYEILEKIASGGMADAFKARRSGVEGFQKIVAIKKILPHLADNEQFIAMFADEAKLAAQLSHPNIIHIYDLGKIEAGGYFIAMEYVDGRDLRGILQIAREVATPIPVPLAIYIASKIASALDYAHRRRDTDGRELAIVHRDVSPQNILISFEGDIKLCDFGIAKAASKASTTQSGALKGKVQYMSPEQAWGRPIDRRSDLFSLGSVLFEMLTGEPLFRGDNDLNLLEKVRAAAAPAPSSLNPEVPKSLDAILAKTLAASPDDRYPNASDLLRDLESVLYSYTPAPGSADLAIYLHRQQAEEAASAEAKARTEAGSTAAEAPKKRRSKGAPVARRSTGSAPKFVEDLAGSTPAREGSTPPPVSKPPVPVITPESKPRTLPGVYGAPPSARAHEKKSRVVLFGLIAAAVIVLTGVGWFVLSRQTAPAKPAAAPAVTPLATPGVAASTPVPAALATPVATPLPAGFDPKAVDAEVQRQLAAKKRELQKSQDAGAAPAGKAPRDAGAPAEKAPARAKDEAPASDTGRAVTPAEGAATKTEAAPTPEPAAVPTRPAPAPVSEAPARAAAGEPEVARGDVVGPGPGVVEPELIAPPRVAYPPVARQQRISGRVIVLVFVNENGSVTEARLQQGVASNMGVNQAVVDAVRKSRFRAATKNGVPVKMWRTVVVDVQP